MPILHHNNYFFFSQVTEKLSLPILYLDTDNIHLQANDAETIVISKHDIPPLSLTILVGFPLFKHTEEFSSMNSSIPHFYL